MTRMEILKLYDAEMRADPLPAVGTRHERAGRVLRAVGSENTILFWDLTAAEVSGEIAKQAGFFRAIGAEVEWKVYGHDAPTGLGQRLADAGFEGQEPETFMVFDLGAGSLAQHRTPEIEIFRIEDATGLADMLTVTGRAFGRDDSGRFGAFSPHLHDPTLALYVAYRDGRPVAAARMELPPRRSFAGLWGGGTAPDYRGRGFYRGLVAVRAAEAHRLGYRYLAVDASDLSRPILERMGFIALTSVTGWVLKPERHDRYPGAKVEAVRQ